MDFLRKDDLGALECASLYFGRGGTNRLCIVVFVMFSSSFTFVTWSICHFHCVEDWVRMENDDANS